MNLDLYSWLTVKLLLFDLYSWLTVKLLLWETSFCAHKLLKLQLHSRQLLCTNLFILGSLRNASCLYLLAVCHSAMYFLHKPTRSDMQIPSDSGLRKASLARLKGIHEPD
eukprot:s2725_g15.t1